MRQKLISVEDVTIQTVAVEIKTMLIGKKQMTVGMFRQLPSLDVLDVKDDEVELRGIVWGHVNHHSGCSGFAQDHLHVIWQNEKILYQSSIYPSYQAPAGASRGGGTVNSQLEKLEQAYFNLTEKMFRLRTVGGLNATLTTPPQRAAVTDNDREEARSFLEGRYFGRYFERLTAVEVDGWRLIGDAADLALQYWPAQATWTGQQLNTKIADAAKAAGVGAIVGVPDDTYRRMYNATSTSYEEMHRRFEKLTASLQTHYRILEASDQLFIGG